MRVTRGAAARSVAESSPPVAIEHPVQLSSPPVTPGPRNSDAKTNDKSEPVPKKTALDKPLPVTLKIDSKRKRKRTAPIKDEDMNELPHNLGKIQDLQSLQVDANESPPAKKPRKSRALKQGVSPEEHGQDSIAKASSTSKKSPKRAKNNNYGLTPGRTPYPSWPHPTPAECREVSRLLSSIHGEVKVPKTVPAPSLTVSGCGEVPSVLDALIRTRLSAATSGANSSRAFAGLVQKFGILQEGVGKGSVDWNKVRLADTKDVFEAIRSGGLADTKSKDIKKILQMVWEENQARREQFLASGAAPGSKAEASEEKNAEVARAEENVLSLDYLHLLSNDEAFNAMIKYPGIGPKTASCVLLFCLQRPSFAVDTHVYRLCTWLGWVPPLGDPAGLPPGKKGKVMSPTRESTFAHCEVRIPDDLKYPLHQLFIKHGKTCPRCRAITGENSEGWNEGCIIDHLVKRSGARKGDGSNLAKGEMARKRKVKTEDVDGESDAESSELSDLPSDKEEDDFEAISE